MGTEAKKPKALEMFESGIPDEQIKAELGLTDQYFKTLKGIWRRSHGIFTKPECKREMGIKLLSEGKSIQEVMMLTGKKHTTVMGYYYEYISLLEIEQEEKRRAVKRKKITVQPKDMWSGCAVFSKRSQGFWRT